MSFSGHEPESLTIKAGSAIAADVDITCTNLHPVSEGAATAILTVAIAPFVPDSPAPVMPPFVGESRTTMTARDGGNVTDASR